MDNFDKKHYKDLKRYMKDDGVKSVSVEYAGGMFGNGVTIVYQPMTEGSDNRMVAVSVFFLRKALNAGRKPCQCKRCEFAPRT